MKLKNVNFIERHIEKIVLGVTGLIGLAVIYLYGIQTPNKVELPGAGTVVTPKTIDSEILAKAKALETQLDRKEPVKELRELEVPPYTEAFRGEINQNVAAMVSSAPLTATPFIEPPVEDGPGGFAVHEPVVPAPLMGGIEPQLRTIVPKEVADKPKLRQHFVGGEPYDILFVAMAGTFDTAKMNEQLMTQPDTEARRIPENWWKDLFSIYEIEVERQELLPDGTWSEPQWVQPMPDVVDFHTVPDEMTAPEAPAWMDSAKQHQSIILTPPVWQFKDGAFSPPNPHVASGQPGAPNPLQDQISKLTDAIKRLESQKAFIEKQLENKRLPAAQKTRFQEQLNGVLADLKVNQAELAKLTGAGEKPKPTDRRDPGARVQGGVLGQDSVEWWKIDMNVKPERTYRYRARAHVYNPLFSQQSLPKEQKDKYLKKLTIASDWTEWSQPVTTPATMKFFAMGASQNPAPGMASFELYKFHDGRFHRAEVRATAGDTVSGPVEIKSATAPTTKVTFDTGYVVVDMDLEFEYTSRAGGLPSKTTRILLMDDQGNLITRIVAVDRNSEELRKYQDLVKGTATAAATGK